MNRITKTCVTCQAEFSIIEREGFCAESLMAMQKWCPACDAARGAAFNQLGAKKASEAREEVWRGVCPIVYRETDPAHADLNRAFLDACRAWDPRGRNGLGLMGESRLGKTRCLFLALRRALEAGRSVAYCTHNHFGELVMDAFCNDEEYRYKARRQVDHMQRVDVLLLDDLGKSPSSEQRDSKLDALVEIRTHHGRPILWSANGHGQWLIDRLGADRGAPIVARLAEFSTVVKA